MKFEVPIVIEVEAESREEAVNEACDLADSIAETFMIGASAVVNEHPDLLERLEINVAGTPS